MRRGYQSIIVLLCGLSLPIMQVAAISFENLDLDGGTGLLFSAKVQAPRYGQYISAFKADVFSGAMEALTFFPEHAVYFADNQELQIQNRFGVYRIPFPFSKPQVLNRFPGFTSGAEIQSGKLGSAEASPDGSWLVYQRSESPAFSELVLVDTRTGTERSLARGIETVYETSCVRWSPSSDLLVYEKDHELYYYALAQAKSGRVLDESLRHVGAGRLASVAWASNGQLLYLSGSMVYEIQVAELFTRSLYQDFLKIGRIIGRLPHVFDPNFDRFWLSPDSRVLLLAKGETYLYLYPMHEESQVDGRAWELPLLALPRAASLTQVIWTSENSLIIILQSPDKQGTMRSLVYRMDMTADLPVFKLSESPLIRRVDTDGSTAVVQYADKIGLLAVADWKSQKEYKHPDPLWTFKVGNDGIIVLGKWYAEYIKTSTDQRTFLFFSQAEALGYDNETGLLSIQSKDQSYSLNEQRWLKRSPLTLRAPSTANSLVRVYAEELYSGTYNNIIMTRKVKELGTKALFNAPATAFEAFPTAEEAIDLTLFNHGSRIRSRSVALTFNAIDSAEGLGEILAVLKHYNIKATFFVNGEFMRRYPAAVRELADSGQEIGSLFYTWFNLADQRYRIDTAFLKQGLARNEDEYREITGKEISLLWRTPYFVVNRSVLEAAASLHYTVVGTDVDSLDSVTRDGGRDSGLYRRSAVLVEEILSRKKPGSIISLTVGKPGEHDANSLGRSDFLFQKLDVLINGLIQKGYDIVPVSHLLESAQ